MAPTTFVNKQQRLEARVTPAQKRLIERAAKLRGTSVTAFVVASAQEAAAKTISDFEMVKLQSEASVLFVNAVLRPPEPTQSTDFRDDPPRLDSSFPLSRQGEGVRG